MDKALSIVTGLTFALFLLLVGWLFSGGFCLMEDIDSEFIRRPRSLEGAVTVLGGWFGFWGGVVMLVAVGLVTYGLQELCNYWFAWLVVRAMYRAGQPKDQVAAKVDKCPISGGLKRRLKRWLDSKTPSGSAGQFGGGPNGRAAV